MTIHPMSPVEPSTRARARSSSATRRRLRIPLTLSCLLVTATVVAQSADDPESLLLRRYPFDPACPWGRISNGKGMIVRCLTEEESAAVSRRGAPAAAPVSPTPPPTAAGGAPPVAAPAAPVAGTAAVNPEELSVTVGPIVADQGELSATKLSQPKSRYAKCVSDFGGLATKSGEVHVRFLVRSRGIAEGVSVAKRVNVSAEAARCVSDIVDRRRVGPPEAPLVGATVVIRFDRITK
jgi:hypothetical protein